MLCNYRLVECNSALIWMRAAHLELVCAINQKAIWARQQLFCLSNELCWVKSKQNPHRSSFSDRMNPRKALPIEVAPHPSRQCCVACEIQAAQLLIDLDMVFAIPRREKFGFMLDRIRRLDCFSRFDKTARGVIDLLAMCNSMLATLIAAISNAIDVAILNVDTSRESIISLDGGTRCDSPEGPARGKSHNKQKAKEKSCKAMLWLLRCSYCVGQGLSASLAQRQHNRKKNFSNSLAAIINVARLRRFVGGERTHPRGDFDA